MKILKSIKKYTLLVLKSQTLKYAVVCVAGVLIVGFLDENSVWNHLKNRQRIEELTEERDRFNTAYKRDKAQIHKLDSDPKAIEKIARERYFMKNDDEDIFVMKDVNQDSKSAFDDETAQ